MRIFHYCRLMADVTSRKIFEPQLWQDLNTDIARIDKQKSYPLT